MLIRLSRKPSLLTSGHSNDTEPYLKLHKVEEAIGLYDDGLYLTFNDSQPQHITLQLNTDSPDIESCDVRLTYDNLTVEGLNKVEWQDSVFFRFGYFNYMKLNLMSMVQMFTNDTWYQIDLLLDWTNQVVTVYVDNQQMASDKFFTNSKTTISAANTIILYNLAPATTCKIKNL